MSTRLYDPLDAKYFDPADARAERDRTFQICSDCRICVRFCPSFKDLFSMIDENEDASDVSVLTDRQHEVVVDECYQCKLCYVVCPYTPENGQEWVVDFPRMMLRSLAIEEREGKVSRNAKLLARTDLQGKVATALAPIVNRSNDVGLVRGLMEKTTGIAKDRLLPTFAKVRFSKWFRGHRVSALAGSRGEVALFPTCLVEYQDPGIGEAMVGVFERNGIGCNLPDGEVCCGMPWLDAGDVKKFEEHAAKNVKVLAEAVRAGQDVVVPQPTCAYVLKQEYPDFLGTDDARLVAEHTFDTSEYLMARHREQALDTDFAAGETYETITWQAACHYRAQQIGPKSRDLMALTGAEVTMLERCSAIDGTWGLRAENVEMARQIAKPLMDAVTKSDADLIAGDCHLSNTAIKEGTGKTPAHPLQVLARAYGIVPRNKDAGMRKLTNADIKDLREYERERDAFRAEIISMKKKRRIALGDLMTIVFENAATMRFQIQEMARAERMLRDEQIAHEIETYNELVPDDGELTATLFIEITDTDALREWLPRLTRIQNHIAIEVAGESVPGEELDLERLTREEEITTTVHYLKFRFTDAQLKAFGDSPVSIVVNHPNYEARVDLSEEQRDELLSDFAV